MGYWYPVCVCKCICICTCTCICTCACTCICLCMLVFVFVFVYVYISAYANIYVYVDIYVYVYCVCINKSVCVCVCMCIYIYMHTHTVHGDTTGDSLGSPSITTTTKACRRKKTLKSVNAASLPQTASVDGWICIPRRSFEGRRPSERFSITFLRTNPNVRSA